MYVNVNLHDIKFLSVCVLIFWTLSPIMTSIILWVHKRLHLVSLCCCHYHSHICIFCFRFCIFYSPFFPTERQSTLGKQMRT